MTKGQNTKKILFLSNSIYFNTMAKNRFFIFYLFLVIKEFLNFLVAYFLWQNLKKMKIS
jgi:hypothetical protein